jgi:hypothetical protein
VLCHISRLFDQTLGVLRVRCVCTSEALHIPQLSSQSVSRLQSVPSVSAARNSNRRLWHEATGARSRLSGLRFSADSFGTEPPSSALISPAIPKPRPPVALVKRSTGQPVKRSSNRQILLSASRWGPLNGFFAVASHRIGFLAAWPWPIAGSGRHLRTSVCEYELTHAYIS